MLKGMQSLNERSGAIVKTIERPEKIVGWMLTLSTRLRIEIKSLQTICVKRQITMAKPLKITVCQIEIMERLVEISVTPQEIRAKLQ